MIITPTQAELDAAKDDAKDWLRRQATEADDPAEVEAMCARIDAMFTVENCYIDKDGWPQLWAVHEMTKQRIIAREV